MQHDISGRHAALNDLSEYLLVARPDNDVYDKVMRERQLFYDECGDKPIFSTQPGITIARFIAKDGMEETIIRWMQRVCSKQQSFSVTLNNYSGFPAHTVYLRVQNPNPFHQLVKQLNVIDTYVISCLCPPVKFSASPFLSIAGNLTGELYYKTLRWYAHRSFHESFVVKELLLLGKKDLVDQYKPVNLFGLQPGKIEIPV